MRVLDFIVSGQTLTRDPLCDFTGIAAGSKGYLHARFRFSKEWKGCPKVAVFLNKGREYPVGLRDNMCEIPWEALVDARAVQVYVIVRPASGGEVPTNMTAFPQTVRR